MIRLRHKFIINVFRLLDQMVLVITALVILVYRSEITNFHSFFLLHTTIKIQDAIGILVLITGWIVIFNYLIRYKSDRILALHNQLKTFTKSNGIAALWLLQAGSVFNVNKFNVLDIFIFFIITTILGIIGRIFVRLFLINIRRSGYNYRYLLVIGTNERARKIANKIKLKPELGYKIVGFIADTTESKKEYNNYHSEIYPILGKLENLREIMLSESVDEIIICLSLESRFDVIANIVQHARDIGIVVRLLPDIAEGKILQNMHIEEFEDEHVVTLFRESMLLQLFVKRVIDGTISLSIIIILCPLFLLISLLIKVTSRGPVIFAQNRVGMNQRVFTLYKFRSMVNDAEEKKCELSNLNECDGPVFKIKNDPRVTRIGRFIRKTSIDELPQLFNVLIGEMSLVGPRPPLPDEVKKYDWMFRKRLCVKPGITCIWQISGRNNISFDRWMQMDNDYIDNWSIFLDLQILIKTIPAVIFGRGAS